MIALTVRHRGDDLDRPLDPMLHHAANKPVDIDGFTLDPFGPVRSVMIGDASAIIAVDVPP